MPIKLDPTITWGHILTMCAFVVSFSLAAIFWHTRLVIVEATLLTIASQIESYEVHRVERDERLQERLNRIDDKLDLKEDK